MFAALNSFQVGGKPMLVSDVFSTTLYTGNGGSQSITNGINLSANGGLVWLKNRQSANGHWLSDTSRGINKYLQSQNLDAEGSLANSFTAFNTNGFSIGSNGPNNPSENYVSWTFRKQRLFFDIVTWTGNGTTQTINHNLGSVPGCIMVKQYASNSTQWAVFHRSNGSNGALCLNDTSAFSPGDFWFNAIDPTSTTFTVGGSGETNQSGQSFIAYIFAHNAGGFGTGADNAISCGSYAGSSSNVDINLGYQVQWVLVKNTTASANWQILDAVRGMPSTGSVPTLRPNTSDPEVGLGAPVIVPTATGMTITGGVGTAINLAGNNYIYIAIKAS